MTVATLGTPRGLAMDAGQILDDMGLLRDALIRFGDTRGAEVTTLLMSQWRARVRALERGTCATCGGFTITCTADARCTCPPIKKGKQ